MATAVWIFNDGLGEDCVWKHVPTKLLPPACSHPCVSSLPVVIAVDGEPEDVLKYALRAGTFFTVSQVENMMASRKVKRPEQGSGKHGRVIKLDLCTCLIEELFKDADDNSKQFMIASMLTRKSLKLEEAPELLLKLVSSLDTSEAQQFKKVKMSASTELQVKIMKKKRAQRKHDESDGEAEVDGSRKRKEPASGSRAPPAPDPAPKAARVGSAPCRRDPSNLTPGELKQKRMKAPQEMLRFLPLVSHLYFKWQPQHRKAGVEFPAERDFVCMFG